MTISVTFFKTFWKEKMDPLFYILNILKKIIWNHIFCTNTEAEDQCLKNILWSLRSEVVLHRQFQYAFMHTFSSSTKKSLMNYGRQILLFKLLFINLNLQINMQGAEIWRLYKRLPLKVALIFWGVCICWKELFTLLLNRQLSSELISQSPRFHQKQNIL